MKGKGGGGGEREGKSEGEREALLILKAKQMMYPCGKVHRVHQLSHPYPLVATTVDLGMDEFMRLHTNYRGSCHLCVAREPTATQVLSLSIWAAKC